MARLPSLETRESIPLVLRVGDSDQWLREAAPAAALLASRSFPPRRRDTRRLVFSLPVVRRPRRVAHAGGLLRGGKLEEFDEGSRGRVDAGRCVAPLGQTRRRCVERKSPPIPLRDLLPP